MEDGFPDKGAVGGKARDKVGHGGPGRSAPRQLLSVERPCSLEQPHGGVYVNLASSLSNLTLLSRSFCNSLISFHKLFSA